MPCINFTNQIKFKEIFKFSLKGYLVNFKIVDIRFETSNFKKDFKMEVNLNLSGVNVSAPSAATASSSALNAKSAQAKENTAQSNAEANLSADNSAKDGESTAATNEELKSLSEKLNEQMKALQADINFAFSDDIDGLYIKVTDEKTGEVIRQIPSEEAMRLQEYFKNLAGILFNKES